MLHLHIISAEQGLHCTLSCPQSKHIRVPFENPTQTLYCHWLILPLFCFNLTISSSLQWLTDYTQHRGEKRASSVQHYCCLAPAPKALPTCLSRVRPVWPQGNQQKQTLCRRWQPPLSHLSAFYSCLHFNLQQPLPDGVLPSLHISRESCGIKLLHQNLNILFWFY